MLCGGELPLAVVAAVVTVVTPAGRGKDREGTSVKATKKTLRGWKETD